MKNLKVLALSLLLTAGLAGCNQNPDNGGSTDVTVDPEPTPAPTFVDFTVDTSGCTTDYTLSGTSFSWDFDGIKVYANYSDGSKVEVSSDDVEVSAPTQITGAGVYDILVEWSFEGEDYNDHFNATINYWSNQELNILYNMTQLSYCDEFYPYFKGMEIKTEVENQQLKDWWIEMGNADEDDVEAFVDAFVEITGTHTSNYYGKAYYAPQVMSSLPAGAAEYAGVDEDTAYVIEIAPYTISNSKAFSADDYNEYVVVGLDDQEGTTLIVKNRLVYNQNVYELFGLPTSYIGYPLLDAEDVFLNDPDLLNEYARCAYGLFDLPEITSTAMNDAEWGNFSCSNDYQIANPFDLSLDKFDYAVGLGIFDVTEAQRTAFCTGLETAGFTKEAEPDVVPQGNGTTITYDIYKFTDKFVGEYEIRVGDWKEVYFSDENVEPTLTVSGFNTKIYFACPEINYSVNGRNLVQSVLPLLSLEETDLTYNKNNPDLSSTTLTETGNVDNEAELASIVGLLTGYESAGEAVENLNGSLTQTVYKDAFMIDITVNGEYDEVESETVFTVSFKVYTKSPITSTAELATLITSINGVQFTETPAESGVYVGKYTKYDENSQYGPVYGGMYGYQFLGNVYNYATAGLPDYIVLKKEPVSYGELDNGAASLTFTYATNDGLFAFDVVVYEVLVQAQEDVNGDEVTDDKDLITGGYIAEFTVYEPDEVTVPGTPEEIMDEIVAATFQDPTNKYAKLSDTYYKTSNVNIVYVPYDTMCASDQSYSNYMSLMLYQYCEPTLLGIVPEYFVQVGDDYEYDSDSSAFYLTFVSIDGAYTLYANVVFMAYDMDQDQVPDRVYAVAYFELIVNSVE